MELIVNDLHDDIKKISLTGRLDIQGTGQIETKFATHVASKKAPVLVDLSAVTFISSIGIRLLVSNARALSTRGGKMVLLNPTPMVKEALEAAGIDLLIPIYNEEEKALADLLSADS